jgi:hypothetical protein
MVGVAETWAALLQYQGLQPGEKVAIAFSGMMLLYASRRRNGSQRLRTRNQTSDRFGEVVSILHMSHNCTAAAIESRII